MSIWGVCHYYGYSICRGWACYKGDRKLSTGRGRFLVVAFVDSL
ncbi:hypothetical protein COO91_08073 [Nostoc flagelliforme CCNUN1]|uniref:Uncharacterized protein n=1 Tax=Nostoc flagelliforme CCNUN1 TaxID=2038116 RepID=A0A2K8T2P2_9NOSO|nr:hypothetical protein COO91_08073 [Nostoc flagelliforme CCNUN1]